MYLRVALGRALPPRVRWRLALLKQDLADALPLRLARLAAPLMLRPYLARPTEVDIEITSSCDADCIMCPRKQMRRAPGPMPLPLFQKVVDEAVSLGVRDLVLNGYGEISTLRNARDYLAYIRQRSQSIRVLVNTNGMRLSEALAHAYVEFGVDVINIAIDGATAATFESIRKHLKLDTVEANVRRLIDIRNGLNATRPFIMVHMIHMPENAHETKLFLTKWTGVADQAGIAGIVSRVGSVAVPLPIKQPDPFPCFLLWSQLPVLSDGTVAMCCDDWNGTAGIGNLNSQSIRDVWRSGQRNALRALHRQGRRNDIELCRGCSSPRRPPRWFVQAPTR